MLFIRCNLWNVDSHQKDQQGLQFCVCYKENVFIHLKKRSNLVQITLFKLFFIVISQVGFPFIEYLRLQSYKLHLSLTKSRSFSLNITKSVLQWAVWRVLQVKQDMFALPECQQSPSILYHFYVYTDKWTDFWRSAWHLYTDNSNCRPMFWGVKTPCTICTW